MFQPLIMRLNNEGVICDRQFESILSNYQLNRKLDHYYEYEHVYTKEKIIIKENGKKIKGEIEIDMFEEE